MAVIYGLFDPRKPLEWQYCRYVGQTIKTLPERMATHIWEAKRADSDSYVMRWIRSLLREDLRPTILLIDECAVEDLNNREIEWIAKGRQDGLRLTNSSDGGGGNHGFTHSEEARQKQRLAKLGKPQTEEHIRNAAEATRLARQNDPGIGERISAALTKFYAENPDERSDISRRNQQWWIDHPEARAERSEKERAYNIANPDMVERRNAAIILGHANQDKSPHYCDQCEGGPFQGPAGLNRHISRQHGNREPLMCECGDGPFVGIPGLAIHRGRSPKHRFA